MLLLMVVSPGNDSLSDLALALVKYDDVRLLWAESAKKALDIASVKAIDLIITDERLRDSTGLELAARLLRVNPMINCASVSRLSPESFHEASEGLGIMAQLPTHPGKEHAESLLHRLRQIKNLTSGGN
ncbi:MAG TPA: hypothetical protein HPQ03_11095 [Deltaproteobacteria bacterium]|nr:hypothetical protein [Deltaproteobacteria bacterium]